MKPLSAFLAVLLLSATGQAQTVLVNGLPNGAYILQVNGSAVNVTPATIATIGGVVPPVGPEVPPVTPPVDQNLTQSVATATAAVEEYDLKGQHRRSLAFTLDFLGNVIPNDNNPSTEARDMVRKAADSILGGHASKWGSWWSSLNAFTSKYTNSQFKSAIPQITAGLTGDLAGAGESLDAIPASFFANLVDQATRGTASAASYTGTTFHSVSTYGMGAIDWSTLLEKLLPFIMQLLKLFSIL